MGRLPRSYEVTIRPTGRCIGRTPEPADGSFARHAACCGSGQTGWEHLLLTSLPLWIRDLVMGVPWGLGSRLWFNFSAISSSAIPFLSIALIFIRQP